MTRAADKHKTIKLCSLKAGERQPAERAVGDEKEKGGAGVED